MEAIRVAIPAMRKIWANTSESCKQRDKILEVVLQAEDKLRQALEDGKATLDTCVKP